MLTTRPIGSSGLRVTSAGFGCASIGNLYHPVSDAQAQAVLTTAWARGLRYFDTAPFYGRGRSEQRLGAFLADKPRDSFVISTKVGRLLTPLPRATALPEADGFIDPLPHALRYDYSGDGIEAAFEQSCARLGLTRLDILFVHDLGRFSHGDANTAHQKAFFDSGYDRLVQLRDKGRIRAFGLGVNEVQVCLDVLAHGPLDVILLAGRLTLLDRSAEHDLVPLCQANGTSLVLGGIFNSGILATGPVPGATYDYGPAPQPVLDRVRALQIAAEAQGHSLAQAALEFAHSHPAAAAILLGTQKETTLLRNLDALGLTPDAT